MTQKNTTEMTVELYLKDNNVQFTDRLSQIEHVEDVSLISYNGDFAQ